MKKLIAAVTAAVVIALPAAAGAHVTLNPNTAAAKGFTELLIRVPNEQDNASTTKVAVQFPPGFVSASYQPKPGWTVTVQKRKLAKPVKTDDGEVTEEVAGMTFTGTGKGLGAIPPGAFQDFPISVQVPDKAGQTLWFPALQTYSNGQVVRWITKDESADEPAPHVDVTAAAGEAHAAAPTSQTTTTAAKPAAAATSSDDDAPSKGLVIVALVLGALGLVAGIAALVTRRGAMATR
jgi:periplasmic copper chaperone A